MPIKPPPTGEKFGRLTVTGSVHVADDPRGGRYDWECRCDCGTIVLRRPSQVRRGHTMSCGCWGREHVGHIRRRHGMSHLRIYLNWQGMIQRCENPKHPKYPIYGGRGITVCDRWKVFENFYADMGDRPSPTHSIDRQDNDRGYSPDNCRWATKREQMLNTRPSIAKRARQLGEAIMADYDFTHCKAKLNPAKSISKMLKMRSAIGADTPAGRRISNIDEIRQNIAKATTPDQASYLDASLTRQLRDLEATRRQS